MTKDEAVRHLEKRLADLDNRHVRHYPKWTTPDFVALRILLGNLAQTR